MPQMGLAVRSGAAHARLHRLQLPSDAGVTWDVTRLRELSCILHWSGTVVCVWAYSQWSHPWGASRGTSRDHQALELGGYFSQDPVDAHLWFSGVALLAHGAQELLAVVPVARQAGLAEAVTAGRRYRLHKYFQTDGAGELVLREAPATRRADAWKSDERKGEARNLSGYGPKDLSRENQWLPNLCSSECVTSLIQEGFWNLLERPSLTFLPD